MRFGRKPRPATPVENLRKARAQIADKDHWWGKGEADTTARMCAAQSLSVVLAGHVTYDLSLSLDRIEVETLARAALKVVKEHWLIPMFAKRTGIDRVTLVNDMLGHKAVLEMYDLAIEMLEGKPAVLVAEEDLVVAGD